jgi:hypothetical protein
VGEKEQNIDLIVPVLRIGSAEAEIKVADLDVEVDGFKWSLDDSQSCSLKNTSTLGIQNLISCSSMPSDGNVAVTVEVVDTFFNGKVTKNIDVHRGVLKVVMEGAVDSKTGRDFNLVAKVSFNGKEVDPKDFVFNWSICYGVGESEKNLKGEGLNSWTSDNACEKAGEKIFSVSASNANYVGSDSTKIQLSVPTYKYDWKKGFSFNRNITVSCRNLDLPSCSASNVGSTRECCELFGSGETRKLEANAIDRDRKYCEEGVKYTCSATEVD